MPYKAETIAARFLVVATSVQAGVDVIRRSIKGVLRVKIQIGSGSSVTSNKINMTIGDNETFEAEITDENDNPIPLTSTKIWFTVRKHYTDEDFYIQKKNTLAGGGDDEIKVTDEANGICEIYLVPDDTKDMYPDVYVYDIQINNSNYGTKTPIKNRLFLEEGVTKVNGS